VSGIIFDDDRVLLVQRTNPPSEGLWSFPGGAIQLGETLEEALVREVREETGLTVKIGPLVSAISRIIRDDSRSILYHYILLDYLCTPVAGQVVAGSDAGKACWVPFNELQDLRVTEGLYRIIDRAREKGKTL
jgi:mutator protein MutT